jgi:hypothetical protein
MSLKDRLRPAELAVEPGGKQVERDRFELKADPDGVVRQPCWFCNSQVEFRPREPTGDAAIVLIEVFGSHEHRHGLCHTDCANRSKGSLST